MRVHRLRLMALLVVLALLQGCGKAQPTATPVAPVASPVPDLGGGEIAFVSDRGGKPAIYRMNADGSGVRHLTDSPASDFSAVWRP